MILYYIHLAVLLNEVYFKEEYGLKIKYVLLMMKKIL
jgi:hypothetical protein